jgi:hypothetical protein
VFLPVRNLYILVLNVSVLILSKDTIGLQVNNLAGLGAVNLRLASSALQNFCNLDAADSTHHDGLELD